MTAKTKIKIISGITNPTMHKILRYAFGLDYLSCQIDQGRVCFVAYISKSVDQDKIDEFKTYWADQGVKTNFLKVEDCAPKP